MAFSNDVLIFLMTSYVVPTVIILGASVWFLWKVKIISDDLKEIKDTLKQKEK